MAGFYKYGTSTHTIDDLLQLVSTRLEMTFAKRESDYRGTYHLARDHGIQVEIQPNGIPGDDEEEFYDSAHPEFRVLVLTTTPVPDPTLSARLDSIEGLVHLSRESG
ncbi:hypothetical protein [Streptomyces violarus]|uniref:hypothetical protein n=1 Tax=Streptomyces violarus TaxID=67380 RepID=UPI0021C103E6|nr:hypothetical protein [Streptomyces violarus]MCT9139094.1 hypothetical protein [Streptomyces violarus]